MGFVHDQQSLAPKPAGQQAAGKVRVDADGYIYRLNNLTRRRRYAAGAVHDQVTDQFRPAFRADRRGDAGGGLALERRILSAGRNCEPSEQGHYGKRVKPFAKICHFLLLVNFWN